MERKYFIKRKIVDELQLNKTSFRKIISSGYACLQILPEDGIIGGISAVISLVTPYPKNAVLVPEKYMCVYFKTNSSAYPTTKASLFADLKQLKEDCFFHKKMKSRYGYHESKRSEYFPELEVLYPFFTNKKRFLIQVKNIVEQRMAELIKEELDINPVLVAGPEIWRRRVDPKTDIILLLNFKPPTTSKYAKMGDKIKKESEKKIFPEKMARFFRTHKNISLAAPSNGDYKTLFKNIRILIKNGIKEGDVLRALTINPAKLLGIQTLTGTISKGKLASLFVSDKRIFAEKAKIKLVFVEGKIFDFKKEERKGKPPVIDLSGNWRVKAEGEMNLEFKMTIKQEGNNFTGKLVLERGTLEIEDGFISGDEVTFSSNFQMMGQSVKVEVVGKYSEKKIEGTISMGTFGTASFIASPETIQ